MLYSLERNTKEKPQDIILCPQKLNKSASKLACSVSTLSMLKVHSGSRVHWLYELGLGI